MTLSGEDSDVTKWKVVITGLELKGALKRVSTQIDIELQAAISRIRPELEHDDSEMLRNVATCRAVLHNLVAKVLRIFSDTTDSVASFDVDIAVVEHGQTEKAGSNQASKGGTETGDTTDQ